MSPTRRPTIGVTTQTLQAIDGIPAGLPHSVVMNQRYYEAVASAGGAPVLIPLLEDVDVLRAGGRGEDERGENECGGEEAIGAGHQFRYVARSVNSAS